MEYHEKPASISINTKRCGNGFRSDIEIEGRFPDLVVALSRLVDSVSVASDVPPSAILSAIQMTIDHFPSLVKSGESVKIGLSKLEGKL